MSFKFDRLEEGALVLVTGGTGFIGSSVVTTLLDRGFKVRVSTRSVEKQKLFKQTLEAKYGKDTVELVQVDHYTDGTVWDQILKDVQGLVHLASDVSFSPIYNEVVPVLEAMTIAMLEAVEKASNVRSVVFTSSRLAVFAPSLGKDVNVTVNDWADYFVDMAKAAKPTDPIAPVAVYAASKVRTERVAWDFLAKKKVHFAFNVVLPDFCAGPVANPVEGFYSTHSFLNDLFIGNDHSLALEFMNPAARIVDVRDVGAVHAAALMESGTDRQRFWGAPHKYVVDDILTIWREAFPTKKILPDFKFQNQPDTKIDDEASSVLLKAFKGSDWYSLKDSLIANVQHLA